MSVPDFQSMMRPFLEFAMDGQEHELQHAIEHIALHFKLSPADQEEMLPSGNQSRLDNRVGWCRTHLKVAGAIEYVRRGVFRITQRGKELYLNNPTGINLKILDQFSEHATWHHAKATKETPTLLVSEKSDTPEEQIGELVKDLSQKLSVDILDRLRSMDWFKFERLVLEVLKKMGYGGFRKDSSELTQKSNDEGVDGIINEDQLGLDVIFVQAKRWKDGSGVGRQEIQKFVGALVGKHVSKGVFITTSDFAKTAEEYAKSVPQKIVLIAGPQLAELMIKFGVGVTIASVIELKKIDIDYFEDV